MNTVLVTGAAQGLGEAIVKEFHSLGFKVVAVDISDKVHHSFKEMGEVHSFVTDVTNSEQISSLKEMLATLNISIDILVNNAGILDFFPVTESAPENLETIFKINSFAPFYMVSAFLEDLKTNSGVVILISSESVKMPGLFQPYSGTKIALEALGISSRQELKLLGISLKIIRPGAIDTTLIENINLTKSPSWYTRYFEKFEEQAEKFIGKKSSPQSVAKLVVKAATSSSNKYIYHINHNPWLSVISQLPSRILDGFVVKKLND